MFMINTLLSFFCTIIAKLTTGFLYTVLYASRSKQYGKQCSSRSLVRKGDSSTNYKKQNNYSHEKNPMITLLKSFPQKKNTICYK